jgi:tricorn protease
MAISLCPKRNKKSKFPDQECRLSPNGERVVFSAVAKFLMFPRRKGLAIISHKLRERTNAMAYGRPMANISPIFQTSPANLKFGCNPRQIGSARQVTKMPIPIIFNILWSPDSKKILWNDRKFRLRYADVETGEITEVYKARYGQPNDYAWSPTANG